jgi:hypothetical protein
VSDDREIGTLLALVAQLGDIGDSDDYLDLFTEEAATTMVGSAERGISASTETGRDEIAIALADRRASGMLGPRLAHSALCHDDPIILDGPGRAIADSVYLFYTTTSTAPTVRGIGMYYDVVVYGGKGWKLAPRTITIG